MTTAPLQGELNGLEFAAERLRRAMDTGDHRRQCDEVRTMLAHATAVMAEVRRLESEILMGALAASVDAVEGGDEAA